MFRFIAIAMGIVALAGFQAWLALAQLVDSTGSKSAPSALQPGQFTWNPERAPRGPIVVIVSIPDQLAYVYRDGIRIGVSTVSTGKPGHRTPTGVFTVLRKHRMHHSNLYANEPMPWAERLTWSGVFLHAGGLPGYPSSHGCVHLPLEFAKLLYRVTDRHTTVVIANTASAPRDVLRPGLLIPQDTPGARREPLPAVSLRKPYVWEPERARRGPVAVLVSGSDRRAYVYRNGVRIGEAAVDIANPNTPLSPAVYTMLERLAPETSPLFAGEPAHLWMRVNLSSGFQAGKSILDANERIHLPRAFAVDLHRVLEAGSTLMITDQPATPETRTEPGFTVMDGV